MNIQCPNCKTEYKIDGARIPNKGVYSRCKKCQTKFFVKKETSQLKKKQGRKWVECPECCLTQAPSQTCKYCGVRISTNISSAKERIQTEKETPDKKEPIKKEDVTSKGEGKIPKQSNISDRKNLLTSMLSREIRKMPQSFCLRQSRNSPRRKILQKRKG